MIDRFAHVIGRLAAICLLAAGSALAPAQDPPVAPPPMDMPPPQMEWPMFPEAPVTPMRAPDSIPEAMPDMSELMDMIGPTRFGDAVIQYDPETDSLIIIADEATNMQIGRVIETLDQPVPQVLIKVLFLEVTYTNSLDLGVEGRFEFGSDPRDSVLTDFGVAAATRGGFYNLVTDDLNATLRALATTGRLEVLSRPSVLTRNNESAIIIIGQEIPFIRNTRVTDAGQTINTIEYDDIGIILEVTPHITPDRLVEMQVYPEISTLTAETVPISDTVNAPVIAKRSAQTRVVVADGKTVVIGGLMEDNLTESISKVPLLGDIPLLGVLFRRTIRSKSKTELLIFLTPHVIESVADADRMARLDYRRTEIAPKAFKGIDREKYLEPGFDTEP